MTTKLRNFESKSQLPVISINNNHVVYDYQATKFWKQITTKNALTDINILLFMTTKLRNFESKSQLKSCAMIFGFSCLWLPSYEILKANHNSTLLHILLRKVVYDYQATKFWKQITTHYFATIYKSRLFMTTKLRNFESKSQQHDLINRRHTGCLWLPSYEILKANHNLPAVPVSFLWLFMTTKLRNFESKSQHYIVHYFQSICCLWLPSYEILKANHNCC